MTPSSVFLGTGAAELYPDPFCGCPTCARARANGETRLRSCFLLDPQTMIDFGPDAPAASQHYRAPLDQVRDVLVTHTHEDHFASTTFSVLTMTRLKEPIRFHLSRAGLSWVQTQVERTRDISGSFGFILDKLLGNGSISFNAVDPYETYEIAGKKVTPLATNHPAYGPGETAQNYLVDWERGAWLYACDTGLYRRENLDYLSRYAADRGAPLDVFITEGTFGSCEMDEDSSHMTCGLLCRQLENLLDCGAVSQGTRVFITHINSVQSFSLAEYQAYMDDHSPVRVTVAHDGMRI